MIAMLTGTLAHTENQRAIIDVGGVGYEVVVPQRMVQQWSGVGAVQPGAGAAGQSVTVYVSTQVRQDAIVLYGFEAQATRAAFEAMLAVSGVGPKVALACLDAMPLAELRRAIEIGDVAGLTRLKGVGKKTAQRLALELKGKLPVAFEPLPASSAPSAVDALGPALQKLGYSAVEIDRAQRQLAADGVAHTAPIGERLRAALQRLYRKSP